jgi:hypothetical protein
MTQAGDFGIDGPLLLQDELTPLPVELRAIVNVIHLAHAASLVYVLQHLGTERGQVLEGTSRIETLPVARRLTDYRFLTAFFLAQRVQSFRNRLKSLARDRFTTYIGQTVSAFLDFFQGTINALEPLDVAND